MIVVSKREVTKSPRLTREETCGMSAFIPKFESRVSKTTILKQFASRHLSSRSNYFHTSSIFEIMNFFQSILKQVTAAAIWNIRPEILWNAWKKARRSFNFTSPPILFTFVKYYIPWFIAKNEMKYYSRMLSITITPWTVQTLLSYNSPNFFWNMTHTINCGHVLYENQHLFVKKVKYVWNSFIDRWIGKLDKQDGAEIQGKLLNQWT